MAIFLLPFSEIQSKASSEESVVQALKENRISFPELNPLREKIIDAFGVGREGVVKAWRRLKGKFWEELSVWALPGRVQKEIEERCLVPSPLLGLVWTGDPLPFSEVRWEDRLGTRMLKDIWREKIGNILRDIAKDEEIYDFLRSKDRGAVPLPRNVQRISFEYYRKGRRVINSLPHRAYTLRYILEMGVDSTDLERINFLDYKVKSVERSGEEVRVVMSSEGKYI